MDQEQILPVPRISPDAFRGNCPQWLQRGQGHFIGAVMAENQAPSDESLTPMHRNATHPRKPIDGNGGEMGDTLKTHQENSEN
jgi:hypothetical protein